jgi:hypothetical protein
MRDKKNIVSLIFIILGIWAFLVRKGISQASRDELILASLIYFFCCLPLMLYFGNKETNIPYVPFFGVVFFCYFGITVFIDYTLFQAAFLSRPLIVKVLAISLSGWISFLIAFYTIGGKWAQFLVPHLKVDIDIFKNQRFALGLYFLVVIFRYLVIQFRYLFVSLGGLRHFIEQLPLLTIGIFYLIQLRGKLNLKGKILLWLFLIPNRFLYIISGGGIGPLIYETSVVFYIYLYCRRRIPWLALILLGSFYLLIWGSRDDFRNLAWYGPYQNLNSYRKAFLYLKLVRERTFNEKDYTMMAYKKLSYRTSHLVTFLKTVELTPRYIPYWGGYTYRTLAYSLIPRFIFPDKPQKQVGSEFGHRYHLLAPEDQSTSYNLPFIVEMYINFGPTGVVLGMFIFGLLLRILYTLVNHPDCGDGGLLIGTLLFCNLLNIESDFSLIFGNVFQYALLFYFILRKLGSLKTIKKEGTEAQRQ